MTLKGGERRDGAAKRNEYAVAVNNDETTEKQQPAGKAGKAGKKAPRSRSAKPKKEKEPK